MKTKRLPKNWRELVKKIWANDHTASLYGFAPERSRMNLREMAKVLYPNMLDDRDPLSRAVLPSEDVHLRKRRKATLAHIGDRCLKILDAVDTDEADEALEAAKALFEAERRAGGNVGSGSWCRALARDIPFVVRLASEDERGERLRISPEEAKQTAKALKVVRRNVGWLLPQDPEEVEAAIRHFMSLSNTGRPRSRRTQAIISLSRWHQLVLHDPVYLATAALIRASFGGRCTEDSVRATCIRYSGDCEPDR